MEKKKNSGMLVGILIGIIIMLLVDVCLFATGTISFSNNTASSNKQNGTSEDNTTNQENESVKTQDELGKNDTFSASSESGIVEVIGYVETKEITDEVETGEKYNYVFFHIKETKSEEFKKYLETSQGNSFVRDNAIGLGCIIDNKIKYSNSSDIAKLKEYELSEFDSNKILNSTESNPIKLKLERLHLTYGGGAPVCYSHITNIEVES